MGEIIDFRGARVRREAVARKSSAPPMHPDSARLWRALEDHRRAWSPSAVMPYPPPRAPRRR